MAMVNNMQEDRKTKHKVVCLAFLWATKDRPRTLLRSCVAVDTVQQLKLCDCHK